MVTEHKQDDNQKDCEKTAADKKHDGHADSDPEKNETDHPLHLWPPFLALKNMA